MFQKFQNMTELAWGIVHTTPGKFENTALFATLRPTVQTNLSRKRKHSSNRRNLRTSALRFKQWRHDNHIMIFLWIFLKSKMTGDCCNFKFLRRSVDGKDLMRFQSEISVFNFNFQISFPFESDIRDSPSPIGRFSRKSKFQQQPIGRATRIYVVTPSLWKFSGNMRWLWSEVWLYSCGLLYIYLLFQNSSI